MSTIKDAIDQIKSKSLWETIDVDCDQIGLTITEVKRMFLSEEIALYMVIVYDITGTERAIVYTETHLAPVGAMSFGIDPDKGFI